MLNAIAIAQSSHHFTGMLTFTDGMSPRLVKSGIDIAISNLAVGC